MKPRARSPRATRRRMWRAGGILSWRATLPLAAALVLGLGFLYALRVAARPLAVLVIAIALAEALEPAVGSLARWTSRRMAITGIYLTLVVGGGLAGWLVVPVLVSQARELIGQAPALATTVQSWLEAWEPMSASQYSELRSRALAWAAAWLVYLPVRILSWITYATIILFLSAYWLVGAPSLQRFALSLFPSRRREVVERVLRDTGQAMGGYVRGAAISAAIMGTLAWLGLHVIGVDYALVLGVVTMLGEFVPIIGPILVAIPVVGVALLESPTTAVLALLLFVVLQQLEGQILTPNIMRRQTDVPQTFVLLAVLAGGVIGGLIGVLAAIPVAAATRVIALQVVAPAVRRWTGAAMEEGHRPEVRA